MKLSSKARSIYNELREENLAPGGNQYWLKNKEINGQIEEPVKQVKERVSTSVLSGVTDVLASVKALVSWLHR